MENELFNNMIIIIIIENQIILIMISIDLFVFKAMSDADKKASRKRNNNQPLKSQGIPSIPFSQ